MNGNDLMSYFDAQVAKLLLIFLVSGFFLGFMVAWMIWS